MLSFLNLLSGTLICLKRNTQSLGYVLLALNSKMGNSLIKCHCTLSMFSKQMTHFRNQDFDISQKALDLISIQKSKICGRFTKTQI